MKSILMTTLAVALFILMGSTTRATMNHTVIQRGGNNNPKAVAMFRVTVKLPPGPSFGPETERRAKALQIRHNVIPTGKIGINPLTGEINLGTPLTSTITTSQCERLFKGLRELGYRNADSSSPLRMEHLLYAYVTWQRQGSGTTRGTYGIVTEREIRMIEEHVKSQKTARISVPPRTSPIAPSLHQKRVVFQTSCLATKFGYNDEHDSGVGSPLLNPQGWKTGVSTNYATHRGVAVPMNTVLTLWGIKPFRYTARGEPRYRWIDFAGVRAAGVLVFSHKTNTWHGPYPITDFGPGIECQKVNVRLDLGNGANMDIRGDGMEPVKYKIVAGVFPERAGTNTASL